MADLNQAAGHLAGLLSDDLEIASTDAESVDDETLDRLADAAGLEQQDDASEPETADDVDEDPEPVTDDGAEDDFDPDDEEEPEEVEAADDEGDHDRSDEDVDGTEDSESDQPTYTVKVDGEEITVTLDEALAGYQRQQAFTRKTQELAENRTKLQEQEQGLSQARQQYAQALQQAQQWFQKQLPQEPDWDRASAKEIREYKAKQEQLTKFQQELQAVQAEEQKAQQQRLQARLQEEQELLTSKIPEWVDEEKKVQEQKELVEFGHTTYGFTPEEIGSTVDHRLIVLLRDAMLGQKARRQSEEIRRKNKDRSVTPTPKPGDANSKKRSKGSAKRKARNRVRKSGSVHDAAAAFEELGLVD